MSVVIEAPQLHESLSSDPVAAVVLADLRTRPLRAGERTLFNRFALRLAGPRSLRPSWHRC